MHINVSEFGNSSAAPTPCKQRVAISMPTLVASPQPTDARVRIENPAANTVRVPSLSPSAPPQN